MRKVEGLGLMVEVQNHLWKQDFQKNTAPVVFVIELFPLHTVVDLGMISL